MGTSRRVPGPTGPLWATARGQLTRSVNDRVDGVATAGVPKSSEARLDERLASHRDPPRTAAAPPREHGLTDQDVAAQGSRFLKALNDELRRDPEAFELVATTAGSARRLMAAITSFNGSAESLIPSDATPPAERTASFLNSFVNAIAGPGGRIVDESSRRAAVHCAAALLERAPDVRQAVERAEPRNIKISDDVICLLYQLFFAEAVASLLMTYIEAKLVLFVPFLPAVDPGGQLASWLSEKLLAHAPNPCTQGRRTYPSLESVTEIADAMSEGAVPDMLSSYLERAA